MTKESLIELQKIDCNCNDCIFMERNTEKFKESLDLHHRWQLNHFNSRKNKIIEKAKMYKDKYYDLESWDKLLTEAENMKFMFNKSEVAINFGNCTKFQKPVSFIPNICQIETQDCFKHRREIVS